MKCIIVDDEPWAREGLQELVTKTPGLELAASFNNAAQASLYLLQHPVDLVFLDIEMPGTSGIDFAAAIRDKALVIFTTAHAQYACRSYELDAIDYLLKPYSAERFQRAVSKALGYAQLLRKEEDSSQMEGFAADHVFVRADRRVYKLLFSEILYIEGLKDYVVLHTPGGKILTAMNIKTIHQQLPQELFARVGKSHVVNVRQIQSFDNHTLYLPGVNLPLSDKYREQFLVQYVRKHLLSR